MKTVKLSGLNDLPTPTPCPKCGSNVWKLYRTYMKKSKKEKNNERPIMLFECDKCKYLMAQTLFVSVTPTIGGVGIQTAWTPVKVSPPRAQS